MIMKKDGRNSSKIAILVFASILLPSFLSAQEQLTFVAEREVLAFFWGEDKYSDISIIIYGGDSISTNADVSFSQVRRDSRDWHLLINFRVGNNEFSVLAKDFSPLNTQDTFSNDIFIDYPMDRFDPNFGHPNEPQLAIGEVNTMWVPVFYQNVLMEQNRNRLLEVLPGLLAFEHSIVDEFFPWYINTQADIQNGRAMFYNSVIRLGIGTHIAVRNIRKTDFGYLVDSVISVWDRALRWPWAFLYGSAFWEAYQPGDAITLFLNLDGDYLDVYTVGSDIHVGTFIRVGREFIKQYQSLIRTNTADLTNVIWPQRAEGSTGIPPAFVLPDGFHQEIIENNIESNTENNTENSTEKMDEIVYQESVFVQQNAETNSMLTWVWIVIFGGVVVIVSVAVLVARRKR